MGAGSLAYDHERRIIPALHRLKQVFAEMPNTALSVNEASALAGVEPQICFGILCALEDVRFLSRVCDGRYRRRADDPMD
jgi:hypothetical protein